jgi:hypothetical protein
MPLQTLQHPLINGIEIKVATAFRTLNFRVSESVPLSEQYRKKIDDWCADFFGCSFNEVVKDNEVLMSNGVYFVNATTFNVMKLSNLHRGK